MPEHAALKILTERLRKRIALSDDDVARVADLQVTLREADPSSYLVREGEKPKRCAFILSGFVYRQKITNDGARQIVALIIPGEFTDLENLFLSESDHNVQVLTRASILEIPIEAMRALAIASPAIGKALWIETLIAASIGREWLVNIGRRGARARIAHLLCEFAIRLEAAGIIANGSYELPMTQEQLGDALGLTPVHVNRVLKVLAQDGLIERDRRQISVGDWNALREVADFNPRYLHLEQQPRD